MRENMGIKAMSAIRLTVVTGLVIIASSSQVLAESSTDKFKPLALRKIMRDLGKNMQAISDGISREDWKLVEKNAFQVADHPQPPLTEKVRILSFVGTNVSKFKGHDGKTHNAARELGEIASEEDGYGVIQAFMRLQNTCLACHQRFRRSFQENFYKSSSD